MNVNTETLALVLEKALGAQIIGADYETAELHGGTLGIVLLVTGTAESAAGDKLPFKVVWKTQKQWQRYGDPDSWRREYDLYQSGLDAAFTKSFRWPKCYHAEIGEAEAQIWMEYIDGVSGLKLDGDMLARAAMELGRFQGGLYAQKPPYNLANMSAVDYAKRFYLRYRSWPVVYNCIRSEDCEIPKHICEMLIGVDINSNAIFERIEKLPVVMCHRDFWIANIFHTGDGIALIDWDTAGWGYLGEDIASLIADEADVCRMVECYQKCVPAYIKGFMERSGVNNIAYNCVYEQMLLLFGYRLVEGYLDADSAEEKANIINTLQKIYDIGRLSAG